MLRPAGRDGGASLFTFLVPHVLQTCSYAVTDSTQKIPLVTNGEITAPTADQANPAAIEPHSPLIRGVGLAGATTLNMIDMIGVGPFITIPLIIVAMGGPQAMLGWILGAVLVMCDGMVWAELGAAMPGSGGPYHYLSEAYGPRRLGRMMSFLFIWETIFLAPLSIGSGAVGFTQYATFLAKDMTWTQ